MYRKFRTTVARRGKHFKLKYNTDDYSDKSAEESSDGPEEFCEESADESPILDSIEANTYFPPQKYHIAPLFQHNLTSTFKKDKYWSFNLQLCGDYVMRIDNRGFDDWRAPTGTHRFMSPGVSIQNQKYIQRLDLAFLDAGFNMPSRGFRSMIADVTKSFSSVRSLHLNFEENIHFNDSELLWLSSHISRYMPNLRRLDLRLRWSQRKDSITSKGFKKFCRQISKRLKSLESLIFDFSGDYWKIPDDFYKSLARSAMTYLGHLKDLRILSKKMNDLTLKEMNMGKTRYYKRLENLHLYITCPPNSWLRDCREKLLKNDLRQLVFLFDLENSRNKFHFFALDCFKHFQNLKALNINFQKIQIGPATALNFVGALNTQMKTLGQIKFNSRGCGQFIEVFLQFFESPKDNKLKKLELQLIAEEEKIVKEPLSNFINKSMPNLKSLTDLNLFFEQIQITDEQIESLASCITKHLSELEFINIRLFLCPEITGASVEAFEKVFCVENALSKLKKLSLTFASCSDKITQEQIDSLTASLQKQKPNIEFIIDFEGSQTDSSYVPSEHEESGDNSDMNLADCPEKEGDDEDDQ